MFEVAHFLRVKYVISYDGPLNQGPENPTGAVISTPNQGDHHRSLPRIRSRYNRLRFESCGWCWKVPGRANGIRPLIILGNCEANHQIQKGMFSCKFSLRAILGTKKGSCSSMSSVGSKKTSPQIKTCLLLRTHVLLDHYFTI